MEDKNPTKGTNPSFEINTPVNLTWKKRIPLSDNPTCVFGDSRVQNESDQAGQVKISRDAEDMLIKAKRKPYLTMTALYKELGLSGYKGQKFKLELIRSGLADEVELPTNRRGRKKKLLQITPRGTEYVKTLGIIESTKGRGGAKHIYYQKLLEDWYESRGYTVEVEAGIGSTCLDVLVILKDGARLGIEIALSVQYEYTNAVKALGSGIDRLLFVCESELIMEKLRCSIDPTFQNQKSLRVGYKLVTDYFEKDNRQ